jgi:hypothetical protein
MINQLRHAKEAVEALKSVCTPEQIKHADHLISRAFVLHCQREFEANPGRFREHGPTGGVPEFLDPKFLDSEDGQAQ